MSAADTSCEAGHELEPPGDGPLDRLDAWLRMRRPPPYGTAIKLTIIVGLGWVPLVVLTAIDGTLLGPAASQPFWAELQTHVAMLVTLPAFVLAQPTIHARVARIALHFVRSGVVPADEIPVYHEQLQRVAKLRDSSFVQLAVLVAAFAFGFLRTASTATDMSAWAVDRTGSEPAFTPAGAALVLVSRPILAVWLGMTVWRWVVYVALVARLARLKLRIVASHPDGAGGLAFVDGLPKAFGVTVFGVSATIAASMARDILFRGAHVEQFKLPFAVLVGSLVAVLIGPLTIFGPRLAAAARAARLDYAILAGRHARLFEDRWVRESGGRDDELLGASEISSLADMDASYQNVVRMRTLPVGRAALIAVALPAVVPFVPVAAIEIPIADVLKQLAGALI